MNREKEKGIFVNTITLFGKDIRVVKFEDRLWFVSADVFRAIGIANSGDFYKSVLSEMKRSVDIVGYKTFKRIMLPEYLKLLANRAAVGKFFRIKLFIKEFVDDFLKKSGEEEKELKEEIQEKFKGVRGEIVFTTSFCGEFIRVVKFEDKLWFVSADLRKAIGIMCGGSFCEKAPEEMKRGINIEGHKELKRIILPEGLRFLADRSVRGKIYRHKSVIKKFVDSFLESYQTDLE